MYNRFPLCNFVWQRKNFKRESSKH